MISTHDVCALAREVATPEVVRSAMGAAIDATGKVRIAESTELERELVVDWAARGIYAAIAVAYAAGRLDALHPTNRTQQRSNENE